MPSRNRITIKIGTQLLTDKNQQLDLNNMRSLVDQICWSLTNDASRDIIMISSGAITCGARQMQLRPDTVPIKQAAASIGQILLFKHYYDFFQSRGRCVGQLLLTSDCLSNPARKKNILQTIDTLLAHNIIPIINENDSVSTEEIQFGDNDQLSALIAIHARANHLIILTNTDGVLDENGHIIHTLSGIDHHTFNVVNDDMGAPQSKGGMRSKLMAAKIASDAGIPVTIANGREDHVIHNILTHNRVGTTISLDTMG